MTEPSFIYLKVKQLLDTKGMVGIVNLLEQQGVVKRSIEEYYFSQLKIKPAVNTVDDYLNQTIKYHLWDLDENTPQEKKFEKKKEILALQAIKNSWQIHEASLVRSFLLSQQDRTIQSVTRMLNILSEKPHQPIDMTVVSDDQRTARIVLNSGEEYMILKKLLQEIDSTGSNKS